MDTDKITSDAEVRSTLLHEMAHAAAGRERVIHGYEFWDQVERLLQKSAPITLGFPEAPNNRTFADIVPKKFRLCCKEMEKLESQRATKVERYAKARGLKTQVITDNEIIAVFAEAAYMLPLNEQDAVAAIAKRYDLFDVDRKPKNAWAANIISEGMKVYRKAVQQEQELDELENVNAN